MMNSRFSFAGRIVFAWAMILIAASSVDAAVATWNANPEPDVAGYKLSYGTQSGVHTVVIDVGKVTTYTFNPAPGQRYYVVVQAYNTAGALSDKSAEAIIDVPMTTTNVAPTLEQPANQTTTVNTSASLSLVGSDANGGIVTYSANGLPAGLSINAGTGLISGTPNLVGTFTVTATVSDGTLSASRTFTWTVAAAAEAPRVPGGDSNRAPTIVWPGNQNGSSNTAVSLAISASDPDGQALTFTASGLPSGLSINAGSGVITGIPTSNGQNKVTVTVSDGSLSASTSFNWMISNNSSGPGILLTLAQPPDQQSKVNTKVSLSLSASGKNLSFSATGLPPGLTINKNTGAISGTVQTVGNYQVTVGVSDNTGSVTRTFNWAVVAANGKASTTRASEADDSSDANKIDAGDPSSDPDYVGVAGDFDGDGRADLATYRRSTSEWRIWTSSSKFQESTAFAWGDAGDVPVTADYNGDKVTDLALYRPSTGTWHLWLSNSQTPLAVHWGGPEDRPVALDQDGDGKADLAVVRGGGYAILLSSSNYTKSVTVQ